MCNDDTFSTTLKKQFSSTDDEIAHGLKNLVGAVLGQTVAAAIARHVDGDENMVVQLGRLQNVPPEEERVGKAMDEDGQVFPRRISFVSIDNIMQLYPLSSLEKRMSKFLERRLVQIPILVLRCRASASLPSSRSSSARVLQHRTSVVGIMFTNSQLALLLCRVACPQSPAREGGGYPDARKAEEAKAELEGIPRKGSERCAHGRRRVVQLGAIRRCVEV